MLTAFSCFPSGGERYSSVCGFTLFHRVGAAFCMCSVAVCEGWFLLPLESVRKKPAMELRGKECELKGAVGLPVGLLVGFKGRPPHQFLSILADGVCKMFSMICGISSICVSPRFSNPSCATHFIFLMGWESNGSLWQHPVQLGRLGSLSPAEEITAKKVLLSTELCCLRVGETWVKLTVSLTLSNIPNLRLLALLASWNSTAISPLASWILQSLLPSMVIVKIGVLWWENGWKLFISPAW